MDQSTHERMKNFPVGAIIASVVCRIKQDEGGCALAHAKIPSAAYGAVSVAKGRRVEKADSDDSA